MNGIFTAVGQQQNAETFEGLMVRAREALDCPGGAARAELINFKAAKMALEGGDTAKWDQVVAFSGEILKARLGVSSPAKQMHRDAPETVL